MEVFLKNPVAASPLGQYIRDNIEEFELQFAKGKKGASWKYFGYLYHRIGDQLRKVSSDLYCSICFKQHRLHNYKITSSSCNLYRHLRSVHDIDVSSDSDKNPAMIPMVKLEPPTFSGLELEQKSNDNSLQDTLDIRNLCTSTYRSKIVLSSNLTINLALMCCKDLIPFDIVDGEGFRHFLVTSGATSEKSLIPHSSAISKEALVNIYRLTCQTVSSAFKDSEPTLSMTLERWKEENFEYHTWRFHFSNERFEQMTVSMLTAVNTDKSTVTNVENDNSLKEVEVLCQRFELTDKSIIIIDDNLQTCGTSQSTAGSVKIYHQYCVPHALNNLVNIDGLYKILETSDLLISLYNFFSNSVNVSIDVPLLNKAIEYLKSHIEAFTETPSLESEMGNPKNTFTYSEKRIFPWNLLLALLEAVETDMLTHDKSSDDEGIGTFTEENRREISELLTFFRHLRTGFEILNGSPYASCAVVLLLRAEIQRVLTPGDDCNLLKNLKKNIEKTVYRKFPVTELHVCAALLDPSQRGWSSVQEYLVSQHITFVDFLTSMLKKYSFIDRPEMDDNLKSKAPEMDSECTDMKLKHFETFSSSLEPSWKKARLEILARHITCSESSEVEREVQQYMCSFLSGGLGDEPLLWWNDQKDSFPRLSRLAKIVLAIPAGCSSMEQILLNSDARSKTLRLSLGVDDVIRMLFIHDNYHLLECVT